jgi:hypothetical protein
LAIVIDEFEVVLEPPQQPNVEMASPPPLTERQPVLKPEDIEHIYQRQQLRLQRVWAD